MGRRQVGKEVAGVRKERGWGREEEWGKRGVGGEAKTDGVIGRTRPEGGGGGEGGWEVEWQKWGPGVIRS